MRYALLITLVVGSAARGAEIWSIDFEQGASLKQYAKHLSFGKAKAQVVARGPDGQGHCLRVDSQGPVSSVPLQVKGPIKLQKNLVLEFDHREEIEQGYQGAYLGMIFYVDGKQWFWQSDKFSSKWRRAQIQFGKLRPWRGHQVRLGLAFSGVSLYGRVKDKPGLGRGTRARMTVWFDNIRLYTGHPTRTLSERTRVSESNPPLFDWPRLEGERFTKIQYSLDPAFADNATTTAPVTHTFYMPAKPIEPGMYYWRVWSEADLSEGWSQVQRVHVLPQAHRFTTKPVSLEAITSMPRPRLLEYARIVEGDPDDARKAQLKRSAKREYDKGVPAHPGPWVKGDPRWPTWIDWYGKVAGRITGGTGRRLERMAYWAMLTGDPEMIRWTKEMALQACKWDPNGGSAMRRGDIGAHHLLRGLAACYDVCRDAMTPEERDTLKRIIVARTNQFWRGLNPFRLTAENNHAWLRAFGVGMAGLVLMGDYDPAWEWAECVREIYIGRFLCCLGYQGDNNEGISYWGYGLSFIVQYADMMRAVCGIDLYKHPWLKQTARFPMYCAPPGAWAVSFADTGMPNHGVRGPAQTGWVRRLALRTRDPYALWYSGARDAVAGLAPKPPVDLPQSIHYRYIGWVIFNTSLVDGAEDVTVAMHSGKYYAGHQHPDQNHFVIHAYGDKLAIDGGYYDWYGSAHFKAYSMTTLAHNTLLVDGEGQAVRKRGADGRIKTYFDSPGYGYTVGDASDPDIYSGKLKQFDRQILFIKPGFAIVHDLVAAAKEPVKLDWLLHAIAPIRLSGQDDAVRFEATGKRAALRGVVLLPKGAKVEVKTGFPKEPVNRYSTNPVPKNNYFPEWTIHASPRGAVAKAEYLVPMQIQRLGGSAQPAAQMERVEAAAAQGVQITRGDRRHLALFRKQATSSGTTLKCNGLESDGDVAAIEVDGRGNVKRCFAANATVLRWRGKVLLKSEARKDMAWLDQPELKSGPIKGAAVEVNGKRTALEGYARRQPDGMLRYWWGEVDLPRSDRYRVALAGRTRGRPRVRLGKRELALDAGGAPVEMWLAAGKHTVTVTANGPFRGLRFQGAGVQQAPAVMLPKGYRPKPNSIIVEAEDTLREGAVKGKLMKKVAASAGMAHCCWDTEGQWAEWAFDVAQAGEYELLVRGASVYDVILREIKLDGKPLSPRVGVARFTATGGWCRTADDWRYFRIVGADGRAARVRLDAGKHTLRMEQLGGSMNVDQFVWERAAAGR